MSKRKERREGRRERRKGRREKRKAAKLDESQKSLKKWGEQKWRTKSGKKSSETGEVYLPEAKIERLAGTPEGRKRLAAATRKKRKATKEGKQYAQHGEAAGTSKA